MRSFYILSDPKHIHDWDADTLEAQGISSLQLMEQAAQAFCSWFVEIYPLEEFEHIDVLIGPGNNGGDGAAIVRLLEAKGYTVSAYGFWSDESKRSPDLQANWDRLLASHHPRLHVNAVYNPQPDQVNVAIDAIFGVGISREVSGAFAKTIHSLNDATWLEVVSIDVPSGQKIDGSASDWLCVNANCTCTFGAVKMSAFFPETGKFWGDVHLETIGLEQSNDSGGNFPKVLHPSIFAEKFSGRPRFSHKGTYGHVLVVAGSRGHAGAALLCGRGAYRSGAGLVTFYAPSRIESVLQLGLPEAMVLVDPDEDVLTKVPDVSKYDAIAVGPGLGQDSRSAAMLKQLLIAAAKKPMVIDADALNLIAKDSELFAVLPKGCILTPHPGEFARLAGKSASGLAQQKNLLAFAKTLPDGAVVVLKGQYSAIADGAGNLSYNWYAGNPGMGTGGMGDTLTGAIAAHLATGESAYDAAAIGVLSHAMAGDLAAEEFGQEGLLAGDVAERLGLALRVIGDLAID